MCTVSFIPKGDNHFILTSNRDEKKDRSALPPAIYETKRTNLIYPKDPEANGTWIALSENEKVVCLLNGAFENHEKKPLYRLSRGKVLLDFFYFNSAQEFISNYSLGGIEPFTLVVASKKQLEEIRWNGIKPTLKAMDHTESHIWSSVTLYDEKTINNRKVLFKKWLISHPDPSQQDVINFHKFGKIGDSKFDLVMERDEQLKTISVTSIDSKSHSMLHEDLLSKKSSSLSFDLIDC